MTSQSAVNLKTSILEKASIEEINNKFTLFSVQQRIDFALENLPGEFAMASSFGAQSVVSLHLLTQSFPNLPVVLVDTGYLFEETYQFIDQLSKRFKLNLKVYQSELSSKWQEARFGKRWLHSDEDLNAYNQMNKVEPMERALDDLSVGSWFAGLRRSQAETRSKLPFVQEFKGRIKIHPILDWSNRQLHQYMCAHNLPYHPLWKEGYVSIGDTHSTVRLSEGMTEEETRFGGRIRECGLHSDHLSGL